MGLGFLEPTEDPAEAADMVVHRPPPADEGPTRTAAAGWELNAAAKVSACSTASSTVQVWARNAVGVQAVGTERSDAAWTTEEPLSTPLESGDGGGAHGSAFGQCLLSEAGRQSMPAQQCAEGRRPSLPLALFLRSSDHRAPGQPIVRSYLSPSRSTLRQERERDHAAIGHGAFGSRQHAIARLLGLE
jgi:hypothetical protein